MSKKLSLQWRRRLSSLVGSGIIQLLFLHLSYAGPLEPNNVQILVEPGTAETTKENSHPTSVLEDLQKYYQDTDHTKQLKAPTPKSSSTSSTSTQTPVQSSLIKTQSTTNTTPTTESNSLTTNALTTQAVAVKKSALILYDAPDNVPYKKLGQVYAIMLRNLLGHFDINVDLAAIQTYTAGKIESYDTIFYLGSYFDNPIPQAFLIDVMQTTKTIVWSKYNLWQLAWNQNLQFTQKFGFSFSGVRGLNATPTAANPTPGFFDTVVYQNKSMIKFYQFDAATQTVKADPEIGATVVTDPQKALVKLQISNPITKENLPYIIQSGNFWYIADLPLTYIGPRDRYLVLCDLLHDMLGVNHAVKHQAMVRLEDVSALVDLTTIRQLSDYLSRNRIPFGIATIPHYMDPLGKYNGGIPQEIPLAQATTLLNALQYAKTRGGIVLMHGYTHQYAAVPNPNTAVSADDFEFWNIVQNAPVAEDSVTWATQRLTNGLNELKAKGYTPTIFEFPHYEGSPNSYQAVGPLFKARYERAFYYTSDNPNLNLGVNDPNRDFSAGQFFPYVIYKDYYGQMVLPENLGNIEYDIHTIDPISNINYGWDQLYMNAQYAVVVRDGFASFFFHPFWLETSLHLPAFTDFQKLVQGITRLGYTWTSPATLSTTVAQ